MLEGAKDMAQKRMFDKSITNDDNFLEMPTGSQNLYFHLNMNADDDGFVNNWKSIMKLIGAKEDDMKILITKKYIIPFETGVIVIRHWRINNYLRNDRYIPTKYQKEFSLLDSTENKEYQLKEEMYTNGIPMVDTDKIRIDKNRIDKIRIDKNNIKEKNIKKENETEIDLLIKNNFQDEEIIKTIYEFIKMRKAIKKPLTTRGLELIIKKLYKMTTNVDEQIEILDNSIMNNWQGIFPLKEEFKKTNKGSFDDFKDLWEEARLEDEQTRNNKNNNTFGW